MCVNTGGHQSEIREGLADIFICFSYVREDEETAKTLAQARATTQGWAV